MWLQMQQLGPNGRSVVQCGDQLLNLPVLRFRVAASDDRPQSALGEGSNLRWFAESKERLLDLLRQSKKVHDLSDTRTGKTPSFRDSSHIQIGVGRQHLPPLKSQTDRMLHHDCRHRRVRILGRESVDAGRGIREGMGNKWLSAPA